MDVQFKVNMHTHGFMKDRFSGAAWEYLVNEFMDLYGCFADVSNKCIDDWNSGWNRIETMANMLVEDGVVNTFEEAIDFGMNCDDIGLIPKDIVEQAKKIKTYEDWIEQLENVVVRAINEKMNKPFLEGYIFRDGDLSVFGARFKQKPEWTMDFTLEEVK